MLYITNSTVKDASGLCNGITARTINADVVQGQEWCGTTMIMSCNTIRNQTSPTTIVVDASVGIGQWYGQIVRVANDGGSGSPARLQLVSEPGIVSTADNTNALLVLDDRGCQELTPLTSYSCTNDTAAFLTSNLRMSMAMPRGPPSTDGPVMYEFPAATRYSSSAASFVSSTNATLPMYLVLVSPLTVAPDVAAMVDAVQARIAVTNTTTTDNSLVQIACNSSWTTLCTGNATVCPYAAYIACYVSNAALIIKPYADASVSLSFWLECTPYDSTDTPPPWTFTATLTFAGTPATLATEVRAVGAASSAVAGLTGSFTTAGTASRVGPLQRMTSCSNPDVDGAGDGGMLSLSIGDDDLAPSRGAIVSAAVIVGVVGVVVAGFAIMTSARVMEGGHKSFVAAFSAWHGPSVPAVLFSVLAPSVVSASVSLLAMSSGGGAGDATLAVAALAVVTATFVWTSWTMLVASPRALRLEQRRYGLTHSSTSTMFAPLFHALRFVLHPHHRWVGDKAFKSSFLLLLVDLRMTWYAVLENTGTLLVGIGGGLPGTDGAGLEGCVVVLSLIALFYAVQLAVCVVVRPLSSLFMMVFVAVTAALSLGMSISVIAMVVYSDRGNQLDLPKSERDAAASSANDAAWAAASLGLLIGGISLVKSAIDVVDLLFGALHLLQRQKSTSAPLSVSVLEHSVDEDVAIELMELSGSGLDNNSLILIALEASCNSISPVHHEEGHFYSLPHNSTSSSQRAGHAAGDSPGNRYSHLAVAYHELDGTVVVGSSIEAKQNTLVGVALPTTLLESSMTLSPNTAEQLLHASFNGPGSLGRRELLVAVSTPRAVRSLNSSLTESSESTSSLMSDDGADDL